MRTLIYSWWCYPLASKVPGAIELSQIRGLVALFGKTDTSCGEVITAGEPPEGAEKPPRTHTDTALSGLKADVRQIEPSASVGPDTEVSVQPYGQIRRLFQCYQRSDRTLRGPNDSPSMSITITPPR